MKRSEAVRKINNFIDLYGATGDTIIDFLEKNKIMIPYCEYQVEETFWELEDGEYEHIEAERQAELDAMPRNLPTVHVNSYTGKLYAKARHKYAEMWNNGASIQEIADQFMVSRYRVENELRALYRKVLRDAEINDKVKETWRA